MLVSIEGASPELVNFKQARMRWARGESPHGHQQATMEIDTGAAKL